MKELASQAGAAIWFVTRDALSMNRGGAFCETQHDRDRETLSLRVAVAPVVQESVVDSELKLEYARRLF